MVANMLNNILKFKVGLNNLINPKGIELASAEPLAVISFINSVEKSTGNKKPGMLYLVKN